MTGAGTDPYSQGNVTVVSPNGGTASCRLGDFVGNAAAAKMSYTYFVSAATELFVYKYAVFLEGMSSPPYDVSRFQVTVRDQTGNIIPCGIYLVTPQPGLPGWLLNPNGPNTMLYYKNWASVGIDFSPYIGQSVTIDFETGDEALGGRAAWTYIDAYCQPLALTITNCDSAGLATATAPAGFTYLWNTNPVQTTQTATLGPVIGSTVSCTLTAVTGCQTVLSATAGSPVLFTTPDTVCHLDQITLSASPPGGIFSGNGVSGNIFNASVAWLGSHYIYYTYTDSASNCTSVDSNLIVVELCSGINDEQNQAEGISIYPNPFNDYLIIEWKNNVRLQQIEVLNTLGQKIFSETLKENQSEIKIDLNTESGIYFLRLTADKGTEVLKIVSTEN